MGCVGEVFWVIREEASAKFEVVAFEGNYVPSVDVYTLRKVSYLMYLKVLKLKIFKFFCSYKFLPLCRKLRNLDRRCGPLRLVRC